MRRGLTVRCSVALVAAAMSLRAVGARGQTVAQIAAQRQCSTAGVVGISAQLVETQQCLYPGAFVSVIPHANITATSSRIHAFMQASSRDALWNASRTSALRVNSMFRTLADQYVLYHSGACGLAAQPGRSNHETGTAVDLDNWSAALRAMTNAGCRHPYPGNDDVHFDCPGTDRRADSVRSFQRLWNINNTGDRIAEDGDYGPMTAARMGRTPAGGFSRRGCNTTPPPQDAGPADTGADVPRDVPVDVPRDVPRDLGTDLGSDTPIVDAPFADLGDESDSGAAEDLGVEDASPSGDVGADAAIADAARSDGAVDEGGIDELPEGGCQCRAGQAPSTPSRTGVSIVGLAVAVVALRRRATCAARGSARAYRRGPPPRG